MSGAREAAQALIAEIGAPGPETVLETAYRAVEHIISLRAERDAAISERDRLRRELDALRDEMDRHAHDSEGDLFDDLMTHVLKRYARRLDAILRGES